MRVFIETLVGVVIVTVAVAGVYYLVEAKHARERAAVVAR